MSGVQEITKKYLDMIENILNGKPQYLRGFYNFMADTAVRTKYNYLNYAAAFVEFANKDVTDLQFDDFNNYLAKTSYKENGEQMSSSYRIAVYSGIKKFCEYLYVSKQIKDNYMLYIKRPKAKESQKTIQKRENGYLTESEIKKYLKRVDNHYKLEGREEENEWDGRDKAIIYVFLTTGIRCSALRALDVSDIDLKKGTMTVTDKGEKVRTYDLTHEVCEELESWLGWRKILELEANYNEPVLTTQALFISRKLNRMDGVTVYNVIKKYADCIPGKNITPHKLRATYGTQLYNKTGDIYFVQECMGHSNPKTTELYVREKKQNTKKASEIMGKFL